MKKIDVLHYLRKTVIEETALAETCTNRIYKDWLEGRVSGMKTALFFLGERQAIKEHEQYDDDKVVKRVP